MEGHFPREMKSLTGVLDMAEGFCQAHGLSDTDRLAVDLMLEEVFTNLVKYGGDGGDDIFVGISEKDDDVVVTIIDFESHDFDPSAAPDADVDAPLSERTPGGLGLHLLKRVAHEIDYRHDDRQSRITLTRRMDTVCSK